MDMNGSEWPARMHTYVSPVTVVSRRISGPTSLQLHRPHTITEPPSAWTVPCWHAGSMDSWGCLHTCTHPSARHNWKWDSSDQATCFQSSTVQCWCWWAQVRRKYLCRAVSKGTRVGLRLRKPISMMFRRMVYTLTLLDDLAMIFAAICRFLACWTILFSWSRSCRVFFRPQWCRRFGGLPDSRYSQCTHEMVVRENSQCIVTWDACAPL